MEIRRKEIEATKKEKENEPKLRIKENLRREKEKEVAFALLKAHGQHSVPVCRACGAKIVADANFCTSCGNALFSVLRRGEQKRSNSS